MEWTTVKMILDVLSVVRKLRRVRKWNWKVTDKKTDREEETEELVNSNRNSNGCIPNSFLAWHARNMIRWWNMILCSARKENGLESWREIRYKTTTTTTTTTKPQNTTKMNASLFCTNPSFIAQEVGGDLYAQPVHSGSNLSVVLTSHLL